MFKKIVVGLTIFSLLTTVLLPVAWQAPAEADSGSNQGFENPFPEKFGHLRIGTPICVDINQIKDLSSAFDMGALDKAGFLLQDQNSSGGHSIMGNGYDKKSQDAWGYSVASELGLKKGYVDAVAKFHISKQENASHASSAQHVSAVAWGKSSVILKQGLTEDQLLSCATQDFRNKVADIRKAKNTDEVKRALAEFYKAYGTGFVSGLELGNYGVFVGSANYKSDFDEEKFNVGGGTNISTFAGGVSVAGEYSTQHMNSKAEGSFVSMDFSMPNGSPPGTWVSEFTKQFAGAQLSKLASIEAWNAAFNGTIAKNDPVSFKQREPEKKPLDAYKVKDFNEAIKKMKLERFEKEYMEKHKGQKPTPEDYEKWLKDIQARAKQNVDQINRRHSVGLSDEAGEDNWDAPLPEAAGYDYAASDNLGLGAFYTSVSPDFYRSSDTLPPSNLQDGDISLGSYGITGYTYSPWSDYFPKLLGFEQALSSSQYVMGFVGTWLSIRQDIGQYFNFCTNYTGVAPASIEVNAIAYNKALRQLSDELVKLLESGKYDEDIDKQLEAMFQQKLKDNRFTLFKHYQMIINNYDWLRRMPAGAVPVYAPLPNSKFKFYSYSTQDGQQKRLASPGDSPAPRLVKDNAVRLYPVLGTDNGGNPVFAWVGTRVLVDQQAKKEQLGTFLMELPYDGNPLMLIFYKIFGMFFPVTREAASSLMAESPNLIPDRDTLEDSYWTMKYTDKQGKNPTAILFLQGNACTDVYAAIGHNPVPEKKPDGTEYDVGTIVFVPIDYGDIQLAGGKLPGGGIPMWGESRAEDFVAKLNQLSKESLALDLGGLDEDEDIEDGEFDIYMSRVIQRMQDKASGEKSATGLTWSLVDDEIFPVTPGILARIGEKTEAEEHAVQAALSRAIDGSDGPQLIEEGLELLRPELNLIEELSQELARVAALEEGSTKEKAARDLAERIAAAGLDQILEDIDSQLMGNLPGGGPALLELYHEFMIKNMPFEHQSSQATYDFYRYLAGRQIQGAILLSEYYHCQDEKGDSDQPDAPDYLQLAVTNVAELIQRLDNQVTLLPPGTTVDIYDSLLTQRGEIFGSKVRLNDDGSLWFIADSDYAVDAAYLFFGIDGPMPGPLDPDGPMPGPVPNPTPDPPGPVPGPVNFSGVIDFKESVAGITAASPRIPMRTASSQYLDMPGPIDINGGEEKETAYSRDTSGLQPLSENWRLVETAAELETLLAGRHPGESSRNFLRDNCDRGGLPLWVYLDLFDVMPGADDGTQHVYNILEDAEESYGYKIMVENFIDWRMALIYREK